jgi:hypothetical protein
MKRLFAVVILLDAGLLLVPTRRFGPAIEFLIALVLLLSTALLWLWIRVSHEDY